MKFSSLIFIASSSFALVACGSSNPPPAANPTTTTAGASEEHGKEGHHKEGHADHHKDLNPALKDFHGVLAPVWHTDAGPGRVEKACTNVKTMQDKAAATSDAELIANVKDLDAACAKDGKPEVEAKLKTVHERFHALAKIEKHDEKH